MSLSVTLVEEEDAFHRLLPSWAALWSRMPAATPFQHPAWAGSWWTAFHPGRLQVLAVHDADELVGLAPLYREARPEGARLIPIGIGISDYLDVLVDPAHAEGVGHALAEALAGQSVHFEDCLAEAAALILPRSPRSSERIEPHQACPTLDLPQGGSLGDLLSSRSRRRFRLASNRAARRHERIERATSETAPAIFDRLVHLHGARWASRGEPGVLADPIVRDFHRAAVPRLAQAGLLRLSALWLDDVVAGVYYGLARPGHAYAYLTGFDPEFAFESPGSILVCDAIETAMAESARTFHFLRGQESYKYSWGAVDRYTRRRIWEPAP